MTLSFSFEIMDSLGIISLNDYFDSKMPRCYSVAAKATNDDFQDGHYIKIVDWIISSLKCPHRINIHFIMFVINS